MAEAERLAQGAAPRVWLRPPALCSKKREGKKGGVPPLWQDESGTVLSVSVSLEPKWLEPKWLISLSLSSYPSFLHWGRVCTWTRAQAPPHSPCFGGRGLWALSLSLSLSPLCLFCLLSCLVHGNYGLHALRSCASLSFCTRVSISSHRFCVSS